MKYILYLISFFISVSCAQNKGTNLTLVEQDSIAPSFYYGADLSYVNELEDCGASYKDAYNTRKDPFKIFKDAGANIIRVRLWHNPTWTNYSNFEDVKKTISKAKAQGMAVLLDFHYSDTWADPHKQEIPKAWLNDINNTEALGKLLYDYTYKPLTICLRKICCQILFKLAMKSTR